VCVCGVCVWCVCVVCVCIYVCARALPVSVCMCVRARAFSVFSCHTSRQRASAACAHQVFFCKIYICMYIYVKYICIHIHVCIYIFIYSDVLIRSLLQESPMKIGRLHNNYIFGGIQMQCWQKSPLKTMGPISWGLLRKGTRAREFLAKEPHERPFCRPWKAYKSISLFAKKPLERPLHKSPVETGFC